MTGRRMVGSRPFIRWAWSRVRMCLFSKYRECQISEDHSSYIRSSYSSNTFLNIRIFLTVITITYVNYKQDLSRSKRTRYSF
jgi:hypothetical protein